MSYPQAAGPGHFLSQSVHGAGHFLERGHFWTLYLEKCPALKPRYLNENIRLWTLWTLFSNKLFLK